MEFRDLSIFVAVAKTGSFTKAAVRLGYVQSNITARIQHLENILGTPLFHRHPRGVSITSSGEIMLRYAEKILNLCHEAEQAVQDTATPSGPLRIGAMETITATRLPAILAGYLQQFPDVELSLMAGPSNQLMEAVLNYDIEAAFVAGPVENPLLEESAVIEEELVLVSKPGNMDLGFTDNPKSLTLLAFREGCSYRKRLEQYMDHIGVQTRKVIELGTLEGILGCVAAGLGVSLAPRNVIAQGKHNLATYEIPDSFRKIHTVLVRRTDSFLSPALSKFIQAVPLCRTTTIS